MRQAEATNNLDSYWMGFTGNRQFKANPRLFVGASGMHYTTADGRQVLDGMAGMWCVNAGHCRPEIAQAIAAQAAEMDYAPAFQMGHPKAFELAARLAAMLPGDLDHVFFTNSGSESVDTALKIALAYHRAKGEATRVRLIGRARGYHGACIGGTSVGGIANNRKAFGALLPAVDHLAHTFDLEHNAFSRGEPAWGAHLADELERLVALHDASTIAAVIVEPVACSTGVLVPPKGYLSRLRGICDRHGILLIFDEVITGFGRMGKPFAADYYGVRPDLMTVAKGLSNGAVPMGAVFVRAPIYQAFMNGPVNAVELFHGYTYSAHPLATAASLATLDVYRDDDLFDRAAAMAPYFETAIHTLDSAPHVIDVRNIGLMGAIELAPLPGQPAERAFQAFLKLYEAGLLVRTTGDTIALSPPLIIERQQIDRMVETIGAVLRRLN
jgi:beta-alanine--pyruvate transaminase